MLILSLNFWRRADGIHFVSCPNFALYRNISGMTAFSNVSCYSTYKYLGDNHYTFFKKWGHFQLWLCSCSSICAAILSSFSLKLFTFSTFFHLFKLFLYSFLAFLDIHLSAFSTPSNIQLHVQL